MKKIKITKSPWLLFLPFLFLYSIIIITFSRNQLWGDELRCMQDIENLLHGFYSPPMPDVTLNSGPGYQLFILPFFACQFPLLAIKLLNAVLLYLSVILLFRILQFFVSFKMALLISLFWACYYNNYDFLALMYAETLGIFLLSIFSYFTVKAFFIDKQTVNNKYIYLSGLSFGLLVLTKVIFGYVMLLLLAFSFIAFLINRQAINFKKSTIIFSIAFITTLPYLIYTFQLTGRPLYWAATGGNNLYCMSTLSEYEYGSWFSSPIRRNDSLVWPISKLSQANAGSLNIKNRGYFLPGYQDSIIANNRADFEEICQPQNTLQLDDTYKRLAMRNIKNHPAKFLGNCFANLGRILFNYPYSYAIQKPGTLLRLPCNGIILVFLLLSSLPAIINWKNIPFAIRLLLGVAFIYLGGSVVGSAEVRMFSIAVPSLLIFIAFIYHKAIKINCKKWR